MANRGSSATVMEGVDDANALPNGRATALTKFKVSKATRRPLFPR